MKLTIELKMVCDIPLAGEQDLNVLAKEVSNAILTEFDNKDYVMVEVKVTSEDGRVFELRKQ
ncbi:MAG: hypothetical protein BWY97_00067 [Tenericutes bacterium ADurb.BinA124]|nr:MAG: hypothetical protein BWY97_00067 [Tenericutes bacterium ADurb.BinA124]